MSPEEAQAAGQMNTLLENHLSWVHIEHNSKGTKWEFKVKHYDPLKAKEIADMFAADYEKRYGGT